MSSASPGNLPPGSEQQEMPLIEHLLELRNRLLKMVLAVLVCFAVLFPFRNELYLIMAGPLMELLPVGQSMIATDITATFFAPMKLALVLSVFVAIPVILYQLWSFIARDCTPTKRNWPSRCFSRPCCCFTWAPCLPIT